MSGPAWSDDQSAASRTVTAHRLLVPLTQDRCLARLSPGARAVALISAVHAGRVALIWPAQSRASLGPGEAQEGFAQLEAALPSRLDNPCGSSIGGDMSTPAAPGRVVIGMDPHKRSATI